MTILEVHLNPVEPLKNLNMVLESYELVAQFASADIPIEPNESVPLGTIVFIDETAEGHFGLEVPKERIMEINEDLGNLVQID